VRTARAAEPHPAYPGTIEGPVGSVRGTRRRRTRWSGMGDEGAMRMRAIAQLALAVETGGDLDQAVQAAYMAGV